MFPADIFTFLQEHAKKANRKRINEKKNGRSFERSVRQPLPT
jgi:hypothetical protein